MYPLECFNKFFFEPDSMIDYPHMSNLSNSVHKKTILQSDFKDWELTSPNQSIMF